MDINGFKKLFADSKRPMNLSQAEMYVRKILHNLPYLPNYGPFNRHESFHRMAQRTVCMEIAERLHNASPWEDYREIMAELEWPYFQRVARHVFENKYDGPDGERWGSADAWFVEIWYAYHEIFNRMPGTIPDVAPWRMYKSIQAQVLKKTLKYRRKL